jgi:molybdate transport system permease protein
VESRPVIDRSGRAFTASFAILGGLYALLLAGMLVADLFYTTPGHLLEALGSREIRYSIGLSLASAALSAALSLVVAIPLGYLLSRRRFPGRGLVDALVEVPIVLPPLVVGLSLLILFRLPILRGATYEIPAVIVAQVAVAAAFAVRTMKSTFDQLDPRTERVALTLGCAPAGAFFRVALPEAGKGVVTAAVLAWARSLGEFGPVLVFAGATRMRTEVLATTVFLELSIGRLEAAVAVSLLMVLASAAVLAVVRGLGASAEVRP